MRRLLLLAILCCGICTRSASGHLDELSVSEITNHALVQFGKNISTVLTEWPSAADWTHFGACFEQPPSSCFGPNGVCCQLDLCFEAEGSVPMQEGCPINMCKLTMDFRPSDTIVGTDTVETVTPGSCTRVGLHSPDEQENATLVVFATNAEMTTCKPKLVRHAGGVTLKVGFKMTPADCRVTLSTNGDDFFSTTKKPVADVPNLEPEPAFHQWWIFAIIIGAIFLCFIISLTAFNWSAIRRRFGRRRQIQVPMTVPPVHEPPPPHEVPLHQTHCVSGEPTPAPTKKSTASAQKETRPSVCARVTAAEVPQVTVQSIKSPYRPLPPPQKLTALAVDSVTGPTARATVSVSTTQNSMATVEATQSRTQSEMTPDELEYLAFCTVDMGKRYRLFRMAVRLAERIAIEHGYNLHSLDPTMPADEAEWLSRDAESMVRAVVEAHSVPLPATGATFEDYMDYVQKHSLRECYLVAVLAEYDDPSRMFFLNSTIDRFNLIVDKIPAEELQKGRHPMQLLVRTHKEHPEVFARRKEQYEQLMRAYETDRTDTSRNTTNQYRELVKKNVVLSDREKARPTRIVCTLRPRTESK